MQYSQLVDRISGEGASAWKLHVKATQAAAAGEDVIVMSVGDPDLSTPAGAIEAAVQALRGGDTHYTDVDGRLNLRTAIAEDHRRFDGMDVGPENVIVLSGAQCALFSAIQCVAGLGDEILVLEPAYVTYEAAVQAPGATFITVPQPASKGFRPDFDALRSAITPKTRAIMITTPSNPTGVALHNDELTAIAEIAIKHDLWVISDEVYGALTFEHPHESIAALPGMAERTVTVCSLSKSHAMTGWRVGWAVAPVDLIRVMAKLALCMLYGLPGFVQEAAVVALRDCVEDVAEMKETYRRRRDLALSLLAEAPGVVCMKPEAGMFLMIDVRETGLLANEFAEALYDETGVSLLDATAFGPSAEGYVRLCYAISEDKLTEGCRRISDFLTARATG